MDAIVNSIDTFGRYQKFILFIIGTSTGLVGFTTYISVFSMAIPELLCSIKNSSINQTLFLPENNCQTMSMIKSSEKSQELQGSSYQCDFDKRYYGSTMATEWGLICDKAYLYNLSQTIFMVGCFATFFIGFFSDRYGRQKVLCFVTFGTSLILILNLIIQLEVFELSFLTRYFIYAGSQFFLGFTTYVIEIVGFLLALELTSARYASIVSIVFLNMYVLGELYVLLIYYIFRDWKILYWFLTGYSIIITLLVYFILPESPKMLFANKKYAEACEVVNKIKKYNGSKSANLTIKELESDNLISSQKNLISDKNISTWYYLTHPWSNLIKSLSMAYVWFAVSMVYFGVSLGNLRNSF